MNHDTSTRTLGNYCSDTQPLILNVITIHYTLIKSHSHRTNIIITVSVFPAHHPMHRLMLVSMMWRSTGRRSLDPATRYTIHSEPHDDRCSSWRWLFNGDSSSRGRAIGTTLIPLIPSWWLITLLTFCVANIINGQYTCATCQRKRISQKEQCYGVH